MSERAIQFGDEEVRVEHAPKAPPAYDWAPQRLKKFGNDMKNISYTEMVQLSETLSYTLKAKADVDIGPHILAQCMFATIEIMEALPDSKPKPNGSASSTSSRSQY